MATRLSVGAPGRTVPTTSAPSRSANSARWLPANPAMPVIRTFTVAWSLDALSPVLEQILERDLESDRRLPARGHVELRAVAEEERDVGRAHPGGILPHLHLHPGELEEDLQHLARRVAPARADVVDLAGRALLEGEPVRAHHVPHVREVADGLEI